MSDNASEFQVIKQSESLGSTLRGSAAQWLRRMILRSTDEFLEIDYGNGHKKRVLIDTSVIFGRGPNADICITEDAMLSRRHFSIKYERNQAKLVDLLSTNGTWIDGNRIDSVVITSPVTIIAGSTRFFVQLPTQSKHY